MREISAGVPINDPIAPAVIPIGKRKHSVYKDSLISQITIMIINVLMIYLIIEYQMNLLNEKSL